MVGRAVAGAVEECGGGGGYAVDVVDGRSCHPVPHPRNHEPYVSVRDRVSVGATTRRHAGARLGEYGRSCYLTSYQIGRRRQQRHRRRHHHDFVDRDHHYRVPAVSTSPSRQRTDGVDGSNPVAHIQQPAATTGTSYIPYALWKSSCSVRAYSPRQV